MQQKDNKQKDLVIFQWAVSFIAVAFVIVAIFFTRPAPAVRLPGEPNRVRTLGDFRLTDRTGRVVSRAELQNNYLVVNFVFTSCSISCLQASPRGSRVADFATPFRSWVPPCSAWRGNSHLKSIEVALTSHRARNDRPKEQDQS